MLLFNIIVFQNSSVVPLIFSLFYKSFFSFHATCFGPWWVIFVLLLIVFLNWFPYTSRSAFYITGSRNRKESKSSKESWESSQESRGILENLVLMLFLLQKTTKLSPFYLWTINNFKKHQNQHQTLKNKVLKKLPKSLRIKRNRGIDGIENFEMELRWNSVPLKL